MAFWFFYDIFLKGLNSYCIEWGFVVGILSLLPVGGSHMVPQTGEMNNPHLWHHPSQGRGSLDHQDRQPRSPHFHSQGQGSTPSLLYKKTNARLLGLQHHGKCQFCGLFHKFKMPVKLLSYPRDTATALHPLCRRGCWSSRCSLSPLLQPLLG